MNRIHLSLAWLLRASASIGLSLCLAGHAQTTPANPPATSPANPPATSDTRDLNVVTTGKKGAAPNIPRSYALVIGISKYKNLPDAAQLAFPNRDAEDIYTTLISAEGGQFPAENVHKLIDEDATVANIRKELQTWLPSVTRADDRVLVYFAGHGFVSGGEGYLAAYDVDLKNVAKTAYPMADLGRDMGTSIKGKWKVLMTDACHSGAITPEADRSKVNDTLLDLNKSLFSLTASRDREQSLESDQFGGGHGVFTYYVAQGLRGQADTDGDGIVTADELGEYVRENVRNATNRMQNPTADRGSFDQDMVLAYNPTHVKSAGLPPPAFGNLIIESNMDNTEVFVDGKSAGVVSKTSPLRLPGIAPGAHTIKGVHMGYEPDGPRQEQIYPGQDTTVSVRILIARQHNHAADDHFNKGMEFYNKGSLDNYKKAAAEFQQAITIDPKDSRAALYLGRVENAQYEDAKALAAYKLAIDNDPDYMEARSSYAAALLDTGDMDEAIRQLDIVTKRDPSSGMAWYLQSQAFARKGDFKDGAVAAEKAIAATPKNAEAHYWLAECLRNLKDPQQLPRAESEFNQYLALSNFDSGAAGQLNYYLAGYLFGLGSKKRAAQTDIWKELHGQANLGLCDCEFLQGNYTGAIDYCQKSLRFMPNDMFANYRLATIYTKQFNKQNSPGLLVAAKTHFDEVVTLNPDSDEAGRSRKYLQQINAALGSTPKAVAAR